MRRRPVIQFYLEGNCVPVFCSHPNLIMIRAGISHGEWFLNPDEEVHGSAAYGLLQ